MSHLRDPGAVLLLSMYELGHQPLGIAWPRAFLERAGYAPDHIDLAVESLDAAKVRRARFVGIAVPMHTALRLGVNAARRIRELNAECFVCFYGLYAILNSEYLLREIADAVLGGEFEESLVALVRQHDLGEPAPAPMPARSRLERLTFPVPARHGLPTLQRYVHLARNETRVPAGYVEASRGCLHLCLHCPIPPVYNGRFFAVPRETVMADIRQLVAAGAGHITFGDPDFLNGPAHALKLAQALHAEFPEITFDFTAKIEHILRHRDLFPQFAGLGCVFVVSAVESLSDEVLAQLEKGHTGADAREAIAIVRASGIALRPSFVSFTPWTTLGDYLELVEYVHQAGLASDVDPVQFAIRLLVPPGSALLSRPGIRPYLGELDPAGFTYRWTHPDERVDRLYREVTDLVAQAARDAEDPVVTFARIRARANSAAGQAPDTRESASRVPHLALRSPRLTEPWFCCAEPTETQLAFKECV